MQPWPLQACSLGHFRHAALGHFRRAAWVTSGMQPWVTSGMQPWVTSGMQPGLLQALLVVSDPPWSHQPPATTNHTSHPSSVHHLPSMTPSESLRPSTHPSYHGHHEQAPTLMYSHQSCTANTHVCSCASMHLHALPLIALPCREQQGAPQLPLYEQPSPGAHP